MNRDELQEIQENERPDGADLLELSQEDRREIVARLRDNQLKGWLVYSAVFLCSGLLFLVGAISFYRQSRMRLKSNLGIVAGVVVAGIGLRFLQSCRIRLYARILSGDVSDEAILAWNEEKNEVNQRFVDQLNRMGTLGTVLFASIVSLPIFLMIIPATQEFGVMFFFTEATVFLLGLLVFSLISRYQIRTSGTSRHC